MQYKFCSQCGTLLIKAEISGRMRQKCSASGCGFVFWDNPTPVVAAIVEHAGKVILTRNKGWPENWFGIVAGFLEKGETPEQGALREVKEELGLEGEIARYVGHYAFEQRNQIIFAFHVRAWGEIVLGDELEAIQSVAPETIRPWKLGTGPALSDWLESRKKGPNG